MKCEATVQRNAELPNSQDRESVAFAEWLASVKEGDTVAVWIAGERKADEVVTSATDTLIAIGRYRGRKNFRRSDGRICGKMPLRHLIYIGRPD